MFIRHLPQNIPPEDFAEMGAITFKLQGYNIDYALHPMEDGNGDIISVHNNEPTIHNIGATLIDNAKVNGDNQLDHFDGFLSDLYSNAGFEEYDRWKFNRQYAPEDWNYERDGEPDVVLRRLAKD